MMWFECRRPTKVAFPRSSCNTDNQMINRWWDRMSNTAQLTDCCKAAVNSPLNIYLHTEVGVWKCEGRVLPSVEWRCLVQSRIVVGNWCCRQAVGDQSSSDLLLFSWSQLDCIQLCTSSVHAARRCCRSYMAVVLQQLYICVVNVICSIDPL